MGLWYTKDFGFELTGFSNVDYAGCKDTVKSTFGGAQFLGEKLVSWSSKKQDCTTLLTAEAEYVSLSACCTQVLWMRTQLTDYGYHFNKIPFYCDSKSAIAISCNPIQHLRTKSIAVRYHFIKEHVEKGELFGNSKNSQCVIIDFLDTLIDFSMVLWIFMAMHPKTRPIVGLSRSYKAEQSRPGRIFPRHELSLEQSQQGDNEDKHWALTLKGLKN
ncbi:hypothetical protein Tco_0156525 [Tanacetum coccineum]